MKSQSYRISSLDDIMKIPLDRIPAFLVDFSDLVQGVMMAKANAQGMNFTFNNMTWVDSGDGLSAIRLEEKKQMSSVI